MHAQLMPATAPVPFLEPMLSLALVPVPVPVLVVPVLSLALVRPPLRQAP